MSTAIIIAVVLGLIFGWLIFYKNESGGASKGDKKEDCPASDLINKKVKLKAANKKKLLVFIKDKNKITNDDVEKLLSVSDNTAGRYLEEFEKEGFIKQVGKIGRGVYYKIKK